ncbi:uncharacterized protein B0T15DRAFT_569808 [Chaetomium strumarium]|uniref:Uncharacterized protein n=1 Tax=Chaetomium strumarium TaxID=1170767 RepID=A0AAJ0LYW2_9PEZI|nr:hypothetical protein B0T15DRAFT_569808 [Chaetomium strumarium]
MQFPADAGLDDCIEARITQSQRCMQELQRLQQAAEATSRPVRGLHALLKVQQRALGKVAQKQRGPSAASISQAQYSGLKSCCWDDRWAVVRKCRGLVAINKDFTRSPRLPVPLEDGLKPVAVDAVVDSGTTWLKFIYISSKALEYQVVAEGWASEPEDDEDGEAADAVDGGLGHTEFADTVNKIVLAARWNHCQQVHLILPGLREGRSEAVDRMIHYIRHNIGDGDVSVQVSCADSPFLTKPPPPLDDAIIALVKDRDPLVGDDYGRRTGTVNLDLSALVALVTDLQHGPIITQFILDHETDSNELVAQQDILLSVLYPALRRRKLVCTGLAAAYFRKLIDAISTHSEETRANFILPPSEVTSEPLSAEELRQTLQKWSTVPVPDNLYLPVQIVPDIDLPDVEALIEASKLTPMALGVARDSSPLNRSVYCYGWAHRLTTVTGHRGIERQVRLSLVRPWTRGEDSGDERPPDICHRHLGGYLIHRDKPKDWREMMPEGAEIPREVVRWTYPWTT